MLQMFYNVAIVAVFVAVNCEIEYPDVKYCPVVKDCRAPLVYNVKYRCGSDKMCPQGYKCCRSDCYIHKVCVVAVNKNGEKIPLPIVTTDGHTDLTIKEKLIYITDLNANTHLLNTEFTTNHPVDKVTEDFNITANSPIENLTTIIFIKITNNFSEKSDINSTEEKNITFADIFPGTETITTQSETGESTIHNQLTESIAITENTSNVSISFVDIRDIDETAATTITTILAPTETFTEQIRELTTNTKNEDVEGSGGFFTNDDEDKVSSVQDFTPTSSLHVSDDEDLNQGSGSGSDTDDNIVFPDDDLLTTFKPERDEHTTSNTPPTNAITDTDFDFDTYFTTDRIPSTYNVYQSETKNIPTTLKNEVTSSESLLTYIPELNLSTLTEYELTIENKDVVSEGSGNDLIDNEPGVVNEENITETSTVENNFINSTLADTTPFVDFTYKNKTNVVVNTDEIDIDLSSGSTITEPSIVEKTTVVAIVEGSGNEFSDTEYGDVDEEITTYIPENTQKAIIEDSTKSSLNITTPVIDLSVITVTEDEDDDYYYDHDEVDEDIRNNFQGRIISG